jgi:coenzyme PQQ synthesis protein D (PqqD)
MITPATRVVRDPSLISASLGEEIAMLHIDSGRYFFLNDVGAAVWEHLDSPTTAADLCAALTSRYEVPADRCESEVLSLLGNLLEKQLIRVAE